MLGFLEQLLGMVGTFDAIEGSRGDISPTVVVGGIKSPALIKPSAD